jgi:hypothetical protein
MPGFFLLFDFPIASVPKSKANSASMQGISFYIFVNIYALKCQSKLIFPVCGEQVVAVIVLVLEMKTTNLYEETKINSKGILLDIPLACFVLGKLFALIIKLFQHVTKRKTANSARSLFVS